MNSLANVMSGTSANFLRRAVFADAVLSGATGLLMIAGSGILADFLALPASLLLWAGLVLVPYVAFVAYIGTRPDIPRGGVATIIAANAIWTLASIAILVTGAVVPNLLGYAFVIGQAAVVALLGELQYIGLRRQTA